MATAATAIEIGKGFETYGTVRLAPHGQAGLVIEADTAEHQQILGNILRNMRRPGQSDADLLAYLLQKLRGMSWARRAPVPTLTAEEQAAPLELRMVLEE